MKDPRTIPKALSINAEWLPEEEAYVQAFGSEDRRFTYSDFDRRAKRAGTAFREIGVGKGDRIVFMTDTIVEHAVAYVGGLKAGAIVSNLHMREAPNVIRDCIMDLDPEILVCQPKYAEKLRAFVGDIEDDTHLFSFDHAEPTPDETDSFTDLVDASESGEPPVDLNPDDPALVNFTSGTTGQPKGIIHTHGEVIESTQQAHFGYQATRGDVNLHPFPPAFIGWPMMVFTFGSIGAKVVFLDEWDPAYVPDLIERENLTYVVLTPTQWKQVLEAGIDETDTSSVDRIAYGGETMSEDLSRRLQEQVAKDLYTNYGGTEVMNSGTFLFPSEISPETLASVGRPGPNTEMRVIEPNARNPSQKVGRGEIGEIIVRGPAVAEEVWNDPDATERIFHEDGWWFSGDLGRIGSDDLLYLEGRVDNMIISGGMNIYAEAVEGVLEGHPDILEVAVIGTDHAEWGTAVKAYIRAASELTTEELNTWCKDNDDLANYQRPREYAFVDEFPRTNTGKLDRSALRSTK
jgi:fatty-acyl-CoA synthase